MKKRIKLMMFFVLIVSFSSLTSADEIAELKKEIQQLRQDYVSEIQRLQVQINALSKTQPEAPDTKILDVEYVGRHEGPFEKGGLLIKNPWGFGNVSVGGYADIEYENFENSTSTFDQHRWIINIGAELFDRLRFYSEYEIEHGGPDASGGGEAKVEQAWIDYLIADWINLRAGALLVPFGRYNLYHDSDLQDLTDRPLVARRVIPTTWTESGAGIHGEFNPRMGEYEDLILEYEAYVINGLNSGFSDRGLRGARGSIKQDNNQFKSLVGRLTVSPFQGHELGFSGYYGEYDKASHYITGGAVDWFSSLDIPVDVPGLNLGPLELVGEYAYFGMDVPANMNIAELATGFYAQANLHFWPEFLDDTFFGRNFENPTFTLVGRYGWAKIDDDVDTGAGLNEEERFTLGINYRPVESWVFKLEYQHNKTENETLERGDDSGFMASVAMGF
ncbi:MAG: porin [Candidatus Omnitrophota bacterium]